MKRGEIYWAMLDPPEGRRPTLILTRSVAIPVLNRVVAAPITRTVRGIATEVSVGPEEGLPESSVANCDNLLTVPKDVLDAEPVGRLGPAGVRALDKALRHALDIRY